MQAQTPMGPNFSSQPMLHRGLIKSTLSLVVSSQAWRLFIPSKNVKTNKVDKPYDDITIINVDVE